MPVQQECESLPTLTPSFPFLPPPSPRLYNKKKTHDAAALMHAPARLGEKIIKLSCHLFVMILSPLTYLHIKALIKFSKESNAHFKTHSKAFDLVWKRNGFIFDFLMYYFFW